MGEINVADIVRDSIVDGPGLRTVVFVQGCEHGCPGCHNASIQGPGGWFIEAKELAKLLVSETEGELKLTLSGGEPMLQAGVLLELILEIKRLAKPTNIWLYTGFLWEELVADREKFLLAEQCDFIVDGKFVQELKEFGLIFRGSTNQRIINVKEELKRK